jgi:hypothetical protein
MQSRLNSYKAAPEAMKALGAVENYIQARVGLGSAPYVLR